MIIGTSDERLSRLARLFLIYNTLASGERVSGRDLAGRCGVTPRTLRRDLGALAEAGAEVSYDRSLRAYVLERALESHQVELCLDDLLALALVQGAVLSGSPHEILARRAFRKLLGRLPRALREEADAVQGAVEPGGATQRDYGAAPWSEILSAAARQETLEVHYYSLRSDKISWRNIDPYALTMPKGYLQMVGFCHTRRQVLTFALDGVRGLKSTGQRFAKPPGFSLSRWMENSLGTLHGEQQDIVLRFDSSLARWARRRRWTFRHTLEADGDALILRGTVSGIEEIKKELLSWGASVEVLEPAELREQMRAQTQKMAALYNPKPETAAEANRESRRAP
jgi:predicted DNA-binding transcriptional regulator YafY